MNLINVTPDTLENVYHYYEKFLYNSNIILDNTLKGLGSTRQMLIKKGKPSSKDIDFILMIGYDSNNIQTTNPNDFNKSIIKNTVNKLYSIIIKKGIQVKVQNGNKAMFGNVMMTYFPLKLLSNKYKDEYCQVDLMLCLPNKIYYEYLYRLKFYSNEIFDISKDKNIKGLHRTELIRSLIKQRGLSLGANNILRYKWKDDNISLEQFFNIISKKINRSRKKDIKEMWQNLYDVLIKEEDILNEICYFENGSIYLKNRYKIYNITNKSLSKFIDEFFIKEEYRINNELVKWNIILEYVYKIKNIEKYFINFDNVLILIKDLLILNELKDFNLIIEDYKEELKNKTRDNYLYEEVITKLNKLYEYN